MRTLHIHGGFHKTGTAALQKFLLHNEKVMKKVGWQFAKTHHSGNSSASFHFRSKIEGAEISIDNNFFDVLNNTTSDNVIISAEHLSFLTCKEQIRRVLTKLNESFSFIKLYFYVQRQDKAAIAFKQQASRTPFRNASPSSILCGHSSRALPDLSVSVLEYFNYFEKISAWSDVLGKANVICRIYECESSVCKDFSELIGIELDKSSILLEKEVSRARSLIMHKLISLGLGPDDLAELGSRILDDDEILRCSSIDSTAFLNLFNNSNEMLIKKFGHTEWYNEFNIKNVPIRESNEFWTEKALTQLRFFLDELFGRDVSHYEVNNTRSKSLSIFRQNKGGSSASLDGHFDAHYSVEDRVQYYLGATRRMTVEEANSLEAMDACNFENDNTFVGTSSEIAKIKSPGSYVSDFLSIVDSCSFTKASTLFILQFGDQAAKENSPKFLKSRNIKEKKGIILKLNTSRHWNNLHIDKTSWNQKRDDVIWRGASTGYLDDEQNVRYSLVKNFSNEFDVGFSEIVQGKKKWEQFLKPKLSVEEHCQFKYIICLEGNDVATSLKWILKSNSVPLMPKPTKETWLMEGRLRPYVHYVPLNEDLSDLRDKVDWCKANDNECKQIAARGQEYMLQFENEAHEALIHSALVEHFIEYTRQI